MTDTGWGLDAEEYLATRQRAGLARLAKCPEANLGRKADARFSRRWDSNCVTCLALRFRGGGDQDQ